MFLRTDNPRTIQLSNVDDYLLNWLEAFLIDRKSQGLQMEHYAFTVKRSSCFQTTVMH